MNSLLLIASGMAGGLAACLLLRFYWAAQAAHGKSTLWRPSGALNEVLYVISHAAMGAGIGLLFWLSWGFTAMTNLSWWQQGAAFGLINAAVFGMLPLVIVRSLLRCDAIIYGLLLSEMAVTCLFAGLACSWSWHKAF